MTKKIRLWVSEHARLRFIERVLVPHGLLFDARFRTESKLYRFLKRLSKQALLGLKNCENENERHFVPWPYPDEGIPGIVLVIDPRTGVLVTCWPSYRIHGSAVARGGGG